MTPDLAVSWRLSSMIFIMSWNLRHYAAKLNKYWDIHVLKYGCRNTDKLTQKHNQSLICNRGVCNHPHQPWGYPHYVNLAVKLFHCFLIPKQFTHTLTTIIQRKQISVYLCTRTVQKKCWLCFSNYTVPRFKQIITAILT